MTTTSIRPVGGVTRSMSVLAMAPLVLMAAATEPPPPTPAISSPDLEAMGEMVPAAMFPGGGAQLYYVDMVLLWEQLGAGTDADEREERIGEFVRVENYALLPQLFQRNHLQFDGARSEVGFSTVEIECELAVLLPPDNLFIDVVSVPVSDVEAALSGDPLWSSLLTTVDTDFGSYYSWGDDAETNLDRISPMRPLGQGGQLAVLGDSTATTIRTLDSADMEAALATSAGESESAATSIVLAPVLDSLAGEAVLQLVATAPGPLFDPGFLVVTESPSEAEELLEPMVFLEPYLSLSIAQIATQEGRTTEVLLVHSDNESAAANGEAVADVLAAGVDPITQRPVGELLPDAEIAVEGPVVRVSLTGQDAFRTAVQMLQTRSLFPGS